MHRECPKCKKFYSGSWAGAVFHHSNPEDKIGYFGGYCRCGAELGESYDWEGVDLLGTRKKVFSSEWTKWRKSLSAAEHRKILGGPKTATIIRFTYHEIFLANDQEQANKRFLELWESILKDVAGRAQIFSGSCSHYDKGMYCASYSIRTAGGSETVKNYLESKRPNLKVRKL